MTGFSQHWYRVVHWLCTHLYYSRVRVRHAERLPNPSDGPILYLSLHRNGAVDGFVLSSVFPRSTFLIARGLRRNAFLRLFFGGIEVLRRKDIATGTSRREVIEGAFASSCELLESGGKLIVFPEGTSTLGPRHLPFESGAARILQRYLRDHPDGPVTVVPLGLHYERAWSFRSRVEVEVGSPVSPQLPTCFTEPRARLELTQRIGEGLESVAAQFRDEDEQRAAEALAYSATLGTPRSYASSLTGLSRRVPRRLFDRWRSINARATENGLWRHQGVPLMPLRRWHLAFYVPWFLLIGPVVCLAAVVSGPALLLTGVLTKLFADDLNVVALIRLLVGTVAMTAWLAVLMVLCALTIGFEAVVFVPVISLAGLLLFYRTRKLAVVIHNGLRAPASLREDILKLHRANLDLLSHEDLAHTSPAAPTPVARARARRRFPSGRSR